MELSSSAAGQDMEGATQSGDGRLWSLRDEPIGDGRYCIFRDRSGWFAGDISLLEIGNTLWLELATGERLRVKVCRKAARNVLFRPDPEIEAAVEYSPT